MFWLLFSLFLFGRKEERSARMAAALKTQGDELMTTIEALNAERTALIDAVAGVEARIDAAIAVEEEGDDIIDAVKLQIEGITLEEDLAGLVAVSDGLKAKIALYKSTIAENTEAAADVYDAILSSKTLVGEISKTIAEIVANISDIEGSIGTVPVPVEAVAEA